MYQYWGFGMGISSEIEFPELLFGEQKTLDLEIRIGKVPKQIKGYSFLSSKFKHTLNEREFLFHAIGIAKYYETEGKTIIIEPNNKVKEMRDIRLYVLATVMASALLHRKRLPFHASAILHRGNLYCISGNSGSGKTTVTSLLMGKGYHIFSDDVLALNYNQNVTTANASYPMLKLWGETLNQINLPEFSNKSFPIKTGMDKYGFFFHNSFDKSSYCIKKIFIIKKCDTPQICLREIKGVEAFQILSRQIYRPILLQSLISKTISFLMISNLAKECKIYEIARPENCCPRETTQYIENLITEDIEK